MALFEIKDFSFSYPCINGEYKEVLKSINLEIESGDFIALCGPTGSGKTTLLKCLKPELTPRGKTSGIILFGGHETGELSPDESVKIGFVQQSAEHQTVTDKVWHEVAFGMENLRYSQSLMSRRLAETMGYFGIDTLFDSGTAELSGGQKQAVALAAVTAMNPRVIILDEPTSQLDPVAASEFLTSLKKLNDEFGITVIITEHRAENVIPLCNKLAVMENGTVTAFGEVRDTISKTAGNERIFDSMPGSVRLWYKLGCDGEIPLTVREGRNMISSLPPEKTGVISEYGRAGKTEEKNNSGSGECALKVKNLYFRYTKESPDALRDTSLTVNKGEIMCMLGANGSGKSTLLAAVSGLVTPYSGKIEIFGKNIKKYTGQSLWNECVALLPQDAQCLFVRSTLKEELEEVGADFDIIPYDLSYAAGTHPYDLSGGEIQLAALAKVMASKPKLLLLDEPTKGLDSYAKNTVVQVLRALKDKGITVLAVTHDVEFAAMCSDRVALLFRGEVTAVDEPHGFFADNIFYTTSINKICRDINPFIIRPEDMI